MNKNNINWGNATWTLFHTLIEKIKEDNYKRIGPIVFNIIKNICSVLPCPDCKQHAIEYLKPVTFKHFPTKEHMKQFFYHFHNNVNIRAKKPIYPYDKINIYENGNLYIIYNRVNTLLNKNYGNPRMMETTIRKKKILQHLKVIIKQHF